MDEHTSASRADIRVSEERDLLAIEVDDDGIGGASLTGGGLAGLRDRAEAFGGSLVMASAPNQSTQLHATLRLIIPSPHVP